ncbi:MAG TPA: TolC family protein [Longimicrobiales bacterium]|nr:TolC family protein [Longimicrobiales bacterium]
MLIEMLLVLAQALPQASPGTDTLALPLSDAVTRALRTGDEARQAEAQTELADAQATVARAAAFPQLRLAHTYQHVYQNARAQAVGSIFNQPNTFNLNANVSQTVFQGGRVVAGWRAGARLRSAAEANELESRQDVALAVVRSYLNALLAERLLRIQEGNLALAADRLKQVEQFQAAGRSAQYDVLRAKVEQANLEPAVIQARSDLELAQLELKRLVNLPMDAPLKLTTAVEPGAVAEVAKAAEDIESAPVKRSALEAAELTARARHDAVAVARADLFPQVSIFFQSGYLAYPLGTRYPLSAGRLEEITCPPGSTPGRACTQQNGGWFSDRSMGINISWPLFDGLRTKGNIDVAQAQARLADLQLRQEREVVAVEVAQARAEFRRAEAAFSARRENVAEATEAFRLASLRFNRGLSTQLDVQDAQLALLTAQTNEARATHDLYLAAAGLARALGRPMPLPDGGSIPTTNPGD